MVVAPVYEFAPPNIKVSALILLIPPVPEITPLIFIPLTTSVVNVKLPVLIPPIDTTKESDVVPDKVPLTIVALLAKVIAPDKVFLFLMFLIAPWLNKFTETPVPLIVIGSGITKSVPSI